jgi:hypothetical protein
MEAVGLRADVVTDDDVDGTVVRGRVGTGKRLSKG